MSDESVSLIPECIPEAGAHNPEQPVPDNVPAADREELIEQAAEEEAADDADASLQQHQQHTPTDENPQIILEAPPLPTPLAPPSLPGASFRDRRGARRRIGRDVRERAAGRSAAAVQRATVDLRLTLDPINKQASLSAVLSRPEGFPESIRLAGLDADTVHAFDDTRYDDIDLEWDCELLAGELRLRDGAVWHEWVRSARPIHLFSASVGEADLLTVPAATLNREHAIVCSEALADEVLRLAREAGSPALTDCSGWSGVPAGWKVFQGYVPAQALPAEIGTDFRPLDPGYQISIELTGGLVIRPGYFAERRAPRILVAPLPENCQVHVDGKPATQTEDGAWEAEGFANPGRHLVDVIPGPSCSYEILADPARNGWPTPTETLWPTVVCNSRICGAAVDVPSGRFAIAMEPVQSLVAVGSGRFVQDIPTRRDAPAAIALLPFEPAFLISSWGSKRTQGSVIWLGHVADLLGQALPDGTWCTAVKAAAARRLPIKPTGIRATSVWKKAVRISRTRRSAR